MKRSFLALTLLTFAVAFGNAQMQRPATARVKTEEIQRQPGAKVAILDLSRKGTIYAVAKDADVNRLKVHTATGDWTVAELIKKSGHDLKGRLRVGLTSDIRSQKLSLRRIASTRLNYDCGDLACYCSGDEDCNDLFTTTKCGPIAICTEDGCVCIRI
jgi:hypothetical protein